MEHGKRVETRSCAGVDRAPAVSGGWRLRRRGRVARAAVAAVVGFGAPGGAVALLAGCAGDAAVGLDPVADVVIEPTAPVVALDRTVQLTATPRSDDGTPLAGRRVFWASADPARAEVSEDGVVTPRAIGAVRIAASVEGRSAVTEVTVTAGSVARIELSPSPVSVVEGSAVTITASMRDAAGNDVSHRPVTWSTSAASVATVDAGGVVRGVAPGTATVTARAEAQSADVAVTVTAKSAPAPAPAPAPTSPRLVVVRGDGQSAKPGSELDMPLVVRAVRADGRPASNVLVTWTGSDGGIARPSALTLTDAQGLASVRWRLGNAERTQTMQAAASGYATATFTAEATRR